MIACGRVPRTFACFSLLLLGVTAQQVFCPSDEQGELSASIRLLLDLLSIFVNARSEPEVCYSLLGHAERQRSISAHRYTEILRCAQNDRRARPVSNQTLPSQGYTASAGWLRLKRNGFSR